jgi:alcohol dehydrogenase (cytochrome c)
VGPPVLISGTWYYSVNGKQYVAVATGNGSGSGQGLAALVPEMKNPDGGSMLWVFALSDK